MKKLIIAIVFLLIAATAAGATTIIVLFDENGIYGAPFMHADWLGTITVDAAAMAVNIKIGDCGTDCTFDRIVGDLPTRMLGHSGFHINVDGHSDGFLLTTFPESRQWSTSHWPGVLLHGGAYCGVGYDQGCAVPEVPTFGLMLIGLAILGWRRAR